MLRAKVFAAFAALLVALALPAVARAQSGIVGIVKDSTGGVLPGVTVEASSPVLIEKTRTAITDDQGQYRLIDLRPGPYVVVFTLPGFNTIRRDGIELPADFTATLNVDMRVGSVEETVTVTGQSPLVDVQAAARPQVLNRQELDALPSGRTVQAVGLLMVGVNLSQADVGGTTALQQTYMSVHGATSGNVTVFVDGVNITGMQGSVQAYWNEAMNQEVSYQTSAVTAEVSGGGVRVNMIPREGGNRFNGSLFANFSNSGLQGSNLSDDLKAAGLTSVDKIDKLWDSNFSQGGPLKKDKVWFFGSFRNFGIWAPVAETFYADGRQGISDEDQQNYTGRMTWQMSPRQKLTAYYDRVYRFRGHSMGAGDDPATAAVKWTTPTTYDSQAKYTMVVTPKTMLEVGVSAISTEFRTSPSAEEVIVPRGSADWYRLTRKTDLDLGKTWGAGTFGLIGPFRNHLNGAVSYVTGSHQFKTGVQFSNGRFRREGDLNGDISSQRYRSGVPDSVTVGNTPRWPEDDLDVDLGVYAQDNWRFSRLTINPGLRYEVVQNSTPDQVSPPGRFKPYSFIPAKAGADWKNWSPRFGAVYDVFGTAKTAIKGSLARYYTSERADFASTYNPAIASTTATLNWTDINSDNIVQGELGCRYLDPGCELNFAQLPAGFGTPALSISPTEDLRTHGRGYNNEYTVGIDQQLFSSMSFGVTWFRRDFSNFVTTDYTDRSPADYTAVTVVSPLDGEVFQVYNLTTSKVALTNRVDRIADPDKRANYYRGVEASFRMRLPGGGSMFGGTSTGRVVSVQCDQPDNPNLLRFCDQREPGNTPPFQTSVKLSGSYQLPHRIQIGMSYVRQPGDALNIDWNIGRTTRYAANCKAPCTPGALVVPGLTEASIAGRAAGRFVPLTPDGLESLPATNNVDFRFGKWFKVNRFDVQGLAEVYNLLNISTPLAVRSISYGTPTFHVPGGSGDVGTRGAIPYARFFKFGIQARW
jgi:carboxypeptidase family protein